MKNITRLFLELFNVVNPVLYLIRYRNGGDPFRQFKIIKRKSKNIITHNSGSNVLIVPYRVSPHSNLFEGLVAEKIRTRGHTVFAMLCGQAVSRCDHVHSTTCRILNCNMCYFEQKRFVDTFDVTPCFVTAYINSANLLEIRNLIRKVKESRNYHIKYLGVEIYPILYGALQRYYLKAVPDLYRGKNIVYDFLETILKTICAFSNIVSEIKPKYVLLSHGVYATWGSVLEYCKAHKLRFIIWGRLYNNGGIMAAHNDSYLSPRICDPVNKWTGRDLTEMQLNIFKKYMDARIGLSNEQVYCNYNSENRLLVSEKDIRAALKIDNKSKIVGLFPNIPWDGQIFRSSRGVFDDFECWLVETIEFFKTLKDATLVIRAHPAEMLKGFASKSEKLKDILSKNFQYLPKQVIYLPPDHFINSYALGMASMIALTYGTNLGLELEYVKRNKW